MMIFRVYALSCAHFLPLVSANHKCRRPHGHNYRVEIQITGTPINGMVMDFADIDKAWSPIHEALDHRTLNDVIGLDNPTAENIARWIAAKLNAIGVSRVTVWETERCGATWSQP